MQIKQLLELAYQDFHSSYYREKDPVSLAHRYSQPRDREVAAFLCALLSYGNVKIILSNANKVLDLLGASPYQAVQEQTFLNRFSSFRHRFTAGEDLLIVCYWLSLALQESGTLENYFLKNAKQSPPGSNMKHWLSEFTRRFTAQKLPKKLETLAQSRSRSLRYLLSDPERGSACKRLNMFLRWMVRKQDGIDFGLWSGLHPKDLMLPVDTHVLQTLQLLRWTRSRTATWQVAEEATESLRLYHAEDPVRYDFALCHLSMAGKSIAMYLERLKEK